jgi:hypothetical protein
MPTVPNGIVRVRHPYLPQTERLQHLVAPPAFPNSRALKDERNAPLEAEKLDRTDEPRHREVRIDVCRGFIAINAIRLTHANVRRVLIEQRRDRQKAPLTVGRLLTGFPQLAA